MALPKTIPRENGKTFVILEMAIEDWPVCHASELSAFRDQSGQLTLQTTVGV
jgi:hypothetical protein